MTILFKNLNNKQIFNLKILLKIAFQALKIEKIKLWHV